MLSKEQESAQRTEFYNKKEVGAYLLKHGVPRSARASKALVAMGTTGNVDGAVNQELLNSLNNVYFEVHPQQINIRDKANGKLIISLRK
ncbi:MAG: hypothetical protein M1503_03015 [Thaumarchaeota archaeon]|nr:hypothetical protein [Nitrososphaerota archaeon]MCL5317223.1 hypothetical protein [Nitrososphaerota archaeon]